MFRRMKPLMRAENRTGILKSNQSRKSLHLSSDPGAAWQSRSAMAAVVA
jgi:hypothetical protein